jgi:hypothetical protein
MSQKLTTESTKASTKASTEENAEENTTANTEERPLDPEHDLCKALDAYIARTTP